MLNKNKFQIIVLAMATVLLSMLSMGSVGTVDTVDETYKEVNISKPEPKEDFIVSGYIEIKEEKDFEDIIAATPQEKKGLVCIDPGHQINPGGGTEPNGPGSTVLKQRDTVGTRGVATGVPEYRLNLDIAFLLRTELESRGYEVIMTRENHETNVSNIDRAQIANNAGADIMVRIHGNGVDNSTVSGALTMAPSSSNPFISHLAEPSYNLSKAIVDEYCAATGMKNRGVTRTDVMTGINWCNMPVTIIEMGFMTNPGDDTNMQNQEFQKKMVLGIANGIDKYFSK